MRKIVENQIVGPDNAKQCQVKFVLSQKCALWNKKSFNLKTHFKKKQKI